MTEPMHPGDRAYRNMLVRLTDLTVNNVELEDLTFDNCRIVGPAIVFPMACEFHNCGFGAQDGDIASLMWEVQADRQRIVGAIGLKNCRFYSCHFEAIGIAGNAAAMEGFREALGGTPN